MYFEVRWTSAARLHLARILAYCGERDPDWALSENAAIAEKIEFIAEFPFLSSIVGRTARGEVRETVAADYRITFEVNEQARLVYIASIFHVRQDDPDPSE